MTFNEGMQIDTSTASASGGGRVVAIGGGLGGLLFLVVALLLGVDPGKVATQLPMNTSQDVAPGFDLNQCRTGADANKYVQCRVVATGTPAALGGTNRPSRVSWDSADGHRTVQTPTPTQVVADLARQAGGEVPGLTVTRPTLEDTYLELIGDPA